MACFVVVLSLLCLVWGGRTLTGAMDWTALQRASLALTSRALCFSVQSAREQQSLQTWFVRCGYAAVILQMVHSVAVGVTYGLANTAASKALTAFTANWAGTMTPCYV